MHIPRANSVSRYGRAMATATVTAVTNVEDGDAQDHYEEDDIRYVEIHYIKAAYRR